MHRINIFAHSDLDGIGSERNKREKGRRKGRMVKGIK
jgi:hypothetical protein